MANNNWMYGDKVRPGINENAIRALGSDALPECVRIEGEVCWDCQFDDPNDCPLLTAPDMRSYYRYLAERADAQLQERQEKIAVLRSVYGSHGLPLHWEVAARIAMEEEPGLFPSQDSVRGIMFFNEVTFRHLGDGVFELK